MISRRNIREKVFHSLYSMATLVENTALLSTATGENPLKVLSRKLNQTEKNFVASLLYTVKIAQYSEIDANNKAAKMLPTADDLAVSTKIAGNTALWDLIENNSFKLYIEENQLESMINEQWVKKIYFKLIETERYKTYISTQERTEDEEKRMMIYIWKNVIFKDQNFQDILSDEWLGYSEDRVLNRSIVDFYFKNPNDFNFFSFLSIEKEKYAKDLLMTVIEKEEYLLELIKPKLKNWEMERVAMIDLILIKMGVCEFLYFPTIPTKVSINEYIEIAKEYSTDDSGKFINAVLDNVLKELTQNNLINKKK